ncbi:MAG: glycosyltransferase [Porphyrobacter sp.]|nr:glycosyltransferase [Porphyrobacter sp.]
MIVRDEARCIVRCLESVRPWVDRMVVLDTGSTDGTMELARKAGALVYEMPWTGSFAEARNRSLELADADWNLVIDADEWIVSGGGNLRSWCQAPSRLGAVCVRSLSEAGRSHDGAAAQNRSQNWLTRMLPRGVRFERRIHEQVVSDLRRSRIALYLDHDGYLAAQVAAKGDRNRALLLQDLEERPGDAYILYQLGQEAAKRAEFDAACDLFRQSLALVPEKANWEHGLVIKYLYSLVQSGEIDAALVYAHQNLARWRHSPDFFFMAGNIALRKAAADPANARREWLPLALSAWERCLEIGDQPHLEDSCFGVGSHLAQAQLDALRAKVPGFAA